ncbi:MAG: cobalt ECF transporter T component CbiQ [Spirochaetes bacterium]|nr:cobalt ECF transporter T component CbiQ [Spirochaetota bacterium]
MTKLENSFFDIDSLETLARQRTFIHRIDGRIKILTTLLFIIVVISFHKYTISMLFPYLIYPLFLLTLGNIPLSVILKKVLILSPLVIFIGIFNPIFDQSLFLKIGTIPVSSGWISFLSIIIRFFLTVSISFILISITGFYHVCIALTKIGVPNVFALQLMLMYRYIFLLIDESIRLVRAHQLRAFQSKIRMKHFIYMISHLLIRTIDRAENIYNAMLARGFHGKLNIISEHKIGIRDITFLFCWLAYFIFFRFFDIAQLFGMILVG